MFFPTARPRFSRWMCSPTCRATPCNVAQNLSDGVRARLITGVNLPMLLRTVSYRHESLEALVSRAMIGGTQGVIQVAVTAPQNQAKRALNDQEQSDHQQ
jgi:PTS system ascorbate-specific IIA component